MSTGLYTLVANGSATATITRPGGHSVTVPISVTSGGTVTAVSVSFASADPTQNVGFVQTASTLQAYAFDQTGTSIANTDGTWSSNDATNAPISSGGLISPASAATGATFTFTHTASGVSGTATAWVLKGGYTHIHGDDGANYAADSNFRANINSGVTTGTHITPAPTGGSGSLYGDGRDEGLVSITSSPSFMGNKTFLSSFPDGEGSSGQLYCGFGGTPKRGWMYVIERYSPGGDTTTFGTSVQFTPGPSGVWTGGNGAYKSWGFQGGGGNWRSQHGYNNGSGTLGHCNTDWYIPDNSDGTNVEVSATPDGIADFDGVWRLTVLLVEERAPCLWSMRKFTGSPGSLPTLVGGVQAEVALQASSIGYYLNGSVPFNNNFNLTRPSGFVMAKHTAKWDTVNGDTYGDPFGILGSQPTPTITSLSISSITHGATSTTLTITGTGFNENCGLVFSNSGITVAKKTATATNSANYTVTSTTIVVVLACTSGATTGAGTIAVKNLASQVTTATQVFSVT